jgi:hypothetical protein
MRLTTLAEKAMLVKLTTRRANLTKRDTIAEEFIQEELGDTSLIVNKKLFRDALNPVNILMAKASEPYTYHKTHTLPYVDKGPRILPTIQYLDYTTNMRRIKQEVEAMQNSVMPKYDAYVQLDIQSRIARDAGKPKPAKYVAPSLDDYPTAEQFEQAMSIDLVFSPLPDARHFLFDISEEDMSAFNDQMDSVAQRARSEVIKRMMEPLKHLVDKLNKPIGTEGHIFRDSAVENVIEGIDMAKKLNVNEDPDIVEMANTIGEAISKYSTNVAVLRESPIVREQAAAKLDYIARQMGGMYQ